MPDNIRPFLDELINSIDVELESPITVSRNGKQLEQKTTILERAFRQNLIYLYDVQQGLSMNNDPEFNAILADLFSVPYIKYNHAIELDNYDFIVEDLTQRNALIGILDTIKKKIEDTVLSLSTNCISTDKFLAFLFKLAQLIIYQSSNQFYDDNILEYGQIPDAEEQTLQDFMETRYVLTVVADPDAANLRECFRLANSIDQELTKLTTLSKNATHLLFKLETFIRRLREIEPGDFNDVHRDNINDVRDDTMPLVYLITLYRVLFMGFEHNEAREMSVSIAEELNSWDILIPKYRNLIQKLLMFRLQSASTRSVSAISITSTNNFLDKLFYFVLTTIDENA